MAICVNCGKTFGNVSRECPYCHAPIVMNNITSMKNIKSEDNNYDCKSNTLLTISAIVPIIGLVYYFMKRDEYPIKSSSALGGFLINILIIVIFVVVLLLAMMMK